MKDHKLMGEMTAKAQRKANRAYAKVLGAIKDVEDIEKMACDAKNNDAAIAAGEVLIDLRRAKIRAMMANGLMGVTIQPGGISEEDENGQVTVLSGGT